MNACAGGFENGDFSRGKSKWLGEGRVVSMKPDGTISETQSMGGPSSLSSLSGTGGKSLSAAIPVTEIKLQSTMFRSLSQSFNSGRGSGALNVEVTFKGSPDFILNDKATAFTKDNTWQAGSTWYWSALVSPKVDLCLRLDKSHGHSYRLEKVNAGGDWQKVAFRWDNVGENQPVTFSIVAPPGFGSLYVKSVSISQ